MTVQITTLWQLLEQNLVRSTLVASGTILLYDFLCTLDQEVAYVWSCPRSISSVLFFLNRYLPFADTFMALRLKFSRNTPEGCLKEYSVVTWLIVLGTIFSEVILLMRTYAIWERKLPVLVIVAMLAGISLIVSVAVVYLEIESLVYVASWDGGCLLVQANDRITGAYISLVLCETIMAVLTVIKFCHFLRDPQAEWVMQLHKDGLLFYAFLLPISLTNIIVPAVAPSMFANWLATPQRVIHSIICTRVLLLILRQRSAAAMINRLPGSGSPDSPFSSVFEEEDTTASIHITATAIDSTRDHETTDGMAWNDTLTVEDELCTYRDGIVENKETCV